MKPYSFSAISLILFLTACLFYSCSKKSSPAPVNTPLSISSLNVNTGPFNTVVKITGTGFSEVIANDVVSFNGKGATVTAATSTQITAIVPVGAGTGNITISINGSIVTGPVFTYQLTATVSTLAGNTSPGSNNGTGAAASFYDPYAIAADVNGNIYVTDMGNNLIRKITPAGVVTTLAGSGASGFANGNGTPASFNDPDGIAVDAAGNVYVADHGNLVIRKITPAGVVTTFAGSGVFGSADGSATAATFSGPSGMAIDSGGNIYLIDENTLRMITTAGVVSTLSKSFVEPLCVAYFNNYLYVTDADKATINKVSLSSVVTLLAGSGTAGLVNGIGTAASFNFPSGLTIDASGNLYVADTNNNLIRMVTPGGTVSTLAGGATGIFAEINGVGTASGFDSPSGMTMDTSGNIYVSDALGNEVRKIVLQ